MADTTFGPDGWTPERMAPQQGKTFVITGGNAGIGFEASRILVRHGAKVVMANRSDERSKAAIIKLQEQFGPDAAVSYIRIDLASLESVRNGAAEILEAVPRIDALICNAAIAQVPKQKLTVDGHESMLGTNHYGHFLLSGLLFDRIEQSNGRIVVVASLGYKMGIRTIQFDDMNWDGNYHQNKTYSQSKLAQMMFAYELQDRLASVGKATKVFVCHPGSSRTSLIETSGNRVTKTIFKLMCMTPMVQPAEKGAYPPVMCATEDVVDQRALYGPTGWNEWIGPVGRGALEPFAYDKAVMERLWELSEKQTSCNWTF